MKKNIIMLVFAIILIIVAVIFYVWVLNFNAKPQQEDVFVEEVSRTKDLEDVEYSECVFYKEDRSEVKLSDYKDKAAMILFWSPENEDSVAVLKKVDSMYEKYKDKINFFMINTSEKTDENLKKEISMEIFYDLYKEGSVKYNIEEIPSMIYITENNEIFNAKSGFTTTDALEANLDLISNNY